MAGSVGGRQEERRGWRRRVAKVRRGERVWSGKMRVCPPPSIAAARTVAGQNGGPEFQGIRKVGGKGERGCADRNSLCPRADTAMWRTARAGVVHPWTLARAGTGGSGGRGFQGDPSGDLWGSWVSDHVRGQRWRAVAEERVHEKVRAQAGACGSLWRRGRERLGPSERRATGKSSRVRGENRAMRPGPRRAPG